MSVENWKTFFEFGGVILLFLTFVFGAGALITTNKINARQAERLRLFDRSLTDAKTELGRQQERAAKAEEDAAEAKKTASSFSLSIADANQRAAEANQKAEAEHLARVRIEDKLAGWRLDATAQGRVIGKLKRFAKTPFDLGANPNELVFMETVDSILTSAGWVRQLPKSDNAFVNILLNNKARINYVSGVYVEMAPSRVGDFWPAATAFADSLQAEGIPVHRQIALEEKDASAVHIVIGSK